MPWNRSRPGGDAVQAKYRTAAHRQARAALLAAHYDGAPCCLCGHAMWGDTRWLHADHLPGTDAYRGLAHRACNVKDGARRARERQTASRLRW